MNERTERRLGLDLTQSQAATQARVSLATWRRWEEDPDAVGAKSRQACEEVLARQNAYDAVAKRENEQLTKAWIDSHIMSPRQAAALNTVLCIWAEGELQMWLDDPSHEPLHTVDPFFYFDKRVMMWVGESRAFAAAVQERCLAVADNLVKGKIPHLWKDPFIDHVLIAAALPPAEALLGDEPELFEGVPARVVDPGAEDGLGGDDAWDSLSDTLDDLLDDDWEVPVGGGSHYCLRRVLRKRHPFTWFDVVPPVGDRNQDDS